MGGTTKRATVWADITNRVTVLADTTNWVTVDTWITPMMGTSKIVIHRFMVLPTLSLTRNCPDMALKEMMYHTSFKPWKISIGISRPKISIKPKMTMLNSELTPKLQNGMS